MRREVVSWLACWNCCPSTSSYFQAWLPECCTRIEWPVQTQKFVKMSADPRRDARTLHMPNWSLSWCLRVGIIGWWNTQKKYHWGNLLRNISAKNLLRLIWNDVGRHDGCSDEFSHFHLQLELHHFHHRYLDASQEKPVRHGTRHRGQVCVPTLFETVVVNPLIMTSQSLDM